MLFTLKKFFVLQSTNNYAKEVDATPGLVILADQQSNGKGSRGRKWYSPPGNLYFSLITAPIAIEKSGQLAYLAAISVGLGLLSLNPKLPIMYKWPNDILLDNLKLAGILIEREMDRSIIGVGVNLKSSPNDILFNYLEKYMSIQINREMILAKILLKFSIFLKVFEQEGFAPIRDLWCKRAWQLGKKITTSQGEEGIFEGIDWAGFLQLRQKDGKIKLIHQV